MKNLKAINRKTKLHANAIQISFLFSILSLMVDLVFYTDKAKSTNFF